MPRTKYRFHPACTIFPRLPDDQLQDLADDIAANGLRNPIVLCQGGSDQKFLEDIQLQQVYRQVQILTFHMV